MGSVPLRNRWFADSLRWRKTDSNISDWQRPEDPFTGAGPMVRIRFPPADSPSLVGFLLPVSKSRQLPRRVRAWPGGMTGRDLSGSSPSRQLPVMSLSGAIPVPHCRLGRFATVVALVRQARGRVSNVTALSWDRLKQSRARSAARASQVADASAPAACLRSDRAADGRRGWLR